MNKARRHELKMLKYHKRLKQLSLIDGVGKLHAYRSHGKPCSCWCCRNPKYKRIQSDVDLKDQLKDEETKYDEIWFDREYWEEIGYFKHALGID